MALNKTNETTTNDSPFEAEETGNAQTTTQTSTPAPAPAPSQGGAVATQRTTAVSVQSQNVLSNMKDSFRVEWDSLPRILATQGAFIFKDDEKALLGDTITMELISYQDQWVCSPNDKKAEVELVKFSSDGVSANDGTDLKEHLQFLKDEGWNKANISQRMVIAGELLTTAKESPRVGALIQIDLPPTGRASFNAYLLQASYFVGKGRKTADEAKQLTLKATTEKNKGGEIYTKIVFS